MSSSQGVRITTDNRGPGVNLVAWILMVFMCFAALTKAFSNVRTVRRLSGDNVLILAAMLMGIAQSIAVTKQVASGLGKRQAHLRPSQIDGYEKAGYAAQMFYIAALGSSKAATLWFIATLSRTDSSRIAIDVSLCLTGLWVVVALFGIAFQCQIPQPWAIISDQCFNQPAFWGVIGAIDMLIDLTLIFLPIHMLWDIHIPRNKKGSVMFAFAARGLVIPLTVLRLVYITIADKSTDQTFDSFNAAVTTQIGMNMAIILTCLPFLKTFMDHVHSGVFASDLRIAPGTDARAGTYGLSALSKYGELSHGKSTATTSPQTTRWFDETHNATITTAIGDSPESRPSSTGSDRMIIKQTRDFTVKSEPAGETGFVGVT